MDRYLKIEDAANKSKDLKQALTLIQDAETRIKQIIFHSFLTRGSVEAIIIRIIQDTVKALPDTIDKEKYQEDLKANANHWLMIAKYTSAMVSRTKTPLPMITTPFRVDGKLDEVAYKEAREMFELGNPRNEDYKELVLELTKEFAKRMADESFKSSTVDIQGLEMKTNISLRASAERQIRDMIHKEENNQVMKNNRLVWISSHADCSERCEHWQGKLYSTDGTEGTVEGHKFIPIETATNSNWVTTKKGKRWNNSILEGFNCRHYTIPFEKGTVPVIKYDREIIEREREITKNMREMERDIISGKTLHRLLIEAERYGKLDLTNYQISLAKQKVRARYQEIIKRYKEYCVKNKRAFYEWRCQILVDRSEDTKNYYELDDVI